MGIGYTLFEHMRLKSDGQWVENFSEYLLPSAHDVPTKIESVILEIPDESGPFGAKGVAEASLVGTAPAITNAIYNAVGVRITDLPVDPSLLVRLDP
jgi:CO/xanthine dehydrogenase Mo-binding subunit